MPATDGHRLVVVRHAKSSRDDPGLADHDRPLAPRGHRALGPLRAHLDGLGLRPDLVLCSSALRAVETLDGFRDLLGPQARVEVEDRLYAASTGTLLERLRAIDDDPGCVVVVGHNPGLADLVDDLLAGDPRRPDDLPTGAVAVLSFAGPWRRLGEGGVTLQSFWRPPRPAPASPG